MAISPNPTQTRIVLSHAQGLVYRSKARFRVVCAGRRFGKTHLAIAIMLFAALEAPGRMIWFVAPTYRQASQVAWKILKSLVTKEYRPKINETDLSLELPNGSIIALRGASDNAGNLKTRSKTCAPASPFSTPFPLPPSALRPFPWPCGGSRMEGSRGA